MIQYVLKLIPLGFNILNIVKYLPFDELLLSSGNLMIPLIENLIINGKNSIKCNLTSSFLLNFFPFKKFTKLRNKW